MMLAVPIRPLAVAAVAVMMLPPSTSGTPLATKPPPESWAATPLTVTTAAGSLTAPVTVSVVAATKLRSAGVPMATAGRVKRCTATLTTVLLPARSVAWTITVLAPSATGTSAAKAPA